MEARDSGELWPCLSCPSEALNRALDSAIGRVIGIVINLDFALQTGLQVGLDGMTHLEFTLLRLLNEERIRRDEEEAERKRRYGR